MTLTVGAGTINGSVTVGAGERYGMQLLATFTAGDTGRDLDLVLSDSDRTALNLTGASAITLVGVATRSSGDVSLSVSGSLIGGVTGGVRFPSIGNAADVPEGRRGADHYTCIVTYVKSALSYKSDKFLLRVESFPT